MSRSAGSIGLKGAAEVLIGDKRLELEVIERLSLTYLVDVRLISWIAWRHRWMRDWEMMKDKWW